MRYYIESTTAGYRFGVQFPNGDEAGYAREGGHDQLERLYAAAEGLYGNLRAEERPARLAGWSTER